MIVIAASPERPLLGIDRLTADRRRDDVDPVGTERGADATEHPGEVAVAKHRHVVLELDVEALAPGLEQVRMVTAADQRFGPTRTLLEPLVTRTRTRSA